MADAPGAAWQRQQQIEAAARPCCPLPRLAKLEWAGPQGEKQGPPRWASRCAPPSSVVPAAWASPTLPTAPLLPCTAVELAQVAQREAAGSSLSASMADSSSTHDREDGLSKTEADGSFLHEHWNSDHGFSVMTRMVLISSSAASDLSRVRDPISVR